MASKPSSVRNLKKDLLGGVIFGCTNKTMKECLSKQLFGVPSQYWSYVKNIEAGLPLFLFNYNDRTMYGIYEAASPGKQYIDSYAWTEDGSERTRYPAQVQVITRVRCQGLPENQFKSIIQDNYYSPTHFWFELDHVQAKKLSSKFSPLAVVSKVVIPKNPPIWKGAQKLPSQSKHEESRGCELFWGDDVVHSVGTACNDNHSVQSSLSNGEARNDEYELMYMKLKQLAIDRDSATSMNGCLVDAASRDHVEVEQQTHGMDGCLVDAATRDHVEVEQQTHEATLMNSGNSDSENSLDSKHYPDIFAKMRSEIEELKTFKQEQTCKIEYLEKKLTEAEQEIHYLENRCMMLESPDEVTHDIKESILLIGGHDGLSWSSALHTFSPSHDHLKYLKPMSSIRAYAAVVQLNHELYALGGGHGYVDGAQLYDTVESYDILNNKWRWGPSLKTKNSCLAGAALNGKIFAIGGGNRNVSFSNVQMLDLDVGNWIPARSMIQKRFGLAAVELNGALYAVGGFDGEDYLKSAERFDPREHSWTRIGSMDTKRGCHSLVVMNEKIYAIGGCDGEKMVDSMEIYDPRADAWMPTEPMSHRRGYFSAAVLNESIYAIGGIKETEERVKTVEEYKEGQGWLSTSLRSVGERCFASAIVLRDA